MKIERNYIRNKFIKKKIQEKIGNKDKAQVKAVGRIKSIKMENKI